MTEMILGTRGSELALTQADRVEAALQSAHPDLVVRREIIKTLGDKRQDLKLSDFSKPADEGEPLIDKGIFIKELESALLDKQIDLAVHSLKDVPTVLEDMFEICAVLPRAPVEDVLVFRNPEHRLATLPHQATVATSSVRRACQLKRMRGDLNIVDIRGNVPTRLRKLVEQREVDGIMLARAGLERLGHDLSGETLSVDGSEVAVQILPPDRFLPAAGQGAIAIEILKENTRTREILAAIHDQPTFQRILVERAFLERLGAGCQTPVGIHTWFDEAGPAGGVLAAAAIVFDEGDKSSVRSARASGPADDPEGLASALMAALKVTTQ